MTHYRMLESAPSVALTSNRNELKVYQGNIVYLNNGDNFELHFFNPTNFKLGIEILFNGVKKGDSYLVLNPGQDIILDRFLDEQRKMLFETYVVNGNNEEAVKAIEQNGVITFNFYKEYYRAQYATPQVNVNYNFPPKPPKPFKVKKGKKSIYNSPYTNNYYYGNSGTSGCAGMSGMSGASGTGGSGGIRGTNHTYSRFFSSTTSNYTSPGAYVCEKDLSYIPNSIDLNSITLTQTSSYNLETGRIELGDISNQNLRTVNAQFAQTPFHTVTYQILPYSVMNRTIGEVRTYCPECGYRLRKESWKFCPKCGEKL